MSPIAFKQWLLAAPAERRPLVMGILNITPDSFSDGGQFTSCDAAVSHAVQMCRNGADIIDIGGESTRPGAVPISVHEQIDRVLPAIIGLRQRLPDATVSIDTTSAAVAEAAIESGATLVNDVSAGRDDPMMLPLVAGQRCPIILMHRQGTSPTMQNDPRYTDVVADVTAFLGERQEAAITAGIAANRVLLDPGIGFGKTTEHDVTLLRAISQYRSLGRPIVVGVSRKKFIGQLCNEPNATRRTFGTAAAVAWSIAAGADIVRVHDVAEMVQVVAVASAFRADSNN